MEKAKTSSEELQLRARAQLSAGFTMAVLKGFTRSQQKLEFSFLGAALLLLDALGLLFSFW